MGGGYRTPPIAQSITSAAPDDDRRLELRLNDPLLATPTGFDRLDILPTLSLAAAADAARLGIPIELFGEPHSLFGRFLLHRGGFRFGLSAKSRAHLSTG